MLIILYINVNSTNFASLDQYFWKFELSRSFITMKLSFCFFLLASITCIVSAGGPSFSSSTPAITSSSSSPQTTPKPGKNFSNEKQIDSRK
jgi:hypothetical protein